MAVPKYILHPTLLLASAGLVLWLAWTHVPSGSDLAATSRSQVVSEQLPAIDSLVAITAVSPDGKLTLSEDFGDFRLLDERFSHLSVSQLTAIQRALVGKFIKRPRNDTHELNLPVEVYDPLCFDADPKNANGCPMTLTR